MKVLPVLQLHDFVRKPLEVLLPSCLTKPYALLLHFICVLKIWKFFGKAFEVMSYFVFWNCWQFWFTIHSFGIYWNFYLTLPSCKVRHDSLATLTLLLKKKGVFCCFVDCWKYRTKFGYFILICFLNKDILFCSTVIFVHHNIFCYTL